MSATTLEASPYGEYVCPDTLVLQRTLPGPIERVWRYLTDSELRQQWLAAGPMSLQPGADFELVWRNDELSASASERPAGFPAESRATCQITQVDPLRELSFHWPGAGDVTFALEAQGSDVLLTVTHRLLPHRAMSVMVGAGWHMHCDILAARLAGTRPGSFWSGWARLRDEYEQRAPR
ncbi:SRPBCC family protein [Ideonella sp. DXS29W]|uniref:SRPBCC family protein n=1 Tax=Ideonella lacteola TaxID=2984193 RepID=A0ABU9C036_9BURK